MKIRFLRKVVVGFDVSIRTPGEITEYPEGEAQTLIALGDAEAIIEEKSEAGSQDDKAVRPRRKTKSKS